MKRYALILLLSLVSSISCILGAQNIEGDTDFWFAAPRLTDHTRTAEFLLEVFACEDATVVVDMPADPSFDRQTIRLGKGEHRSVVLAKTYLEALERLMVPTKVVSQRGLHITSTSPIQCYFQVTRENGESYTLKGRQGLGHEFVVAMQNHCPNANGNVLYRYAYNTIEIVATEDGTEVQIMPNPASGVADELVRLNRGETYAVRSKDKSAEHHLSGTLLRANKPIAVSTTDDTLLPEVGIVGEDGVGDQLVPVERLGQEYVLLSQRCSWEGATLTALYDNTQIALSTGEVITLDEQESRWVSMANRDVLYMRANKPFAVFQITGLRHEVGGAQLAPLSTRQGAACRQYVLLHNSVQQRLHLVVPTDGVSHFADLRGFRAVPGTGNRWSYANLAVPQPVRDSVLTISNDAYGFALGVVDFAGTRTTKNGVTLRSLTYCYTADYQPVNTYHQGYTFRRTLQPGVVVKASNGRRVATVSDMPATTTQVAAVVDSHLYDEQEARIRELEDRIDRLERQLAGYAEVRQVDSAEVQDKRAHSTATNAPEKPEIKRAERPKKRDYDHRFAFYLDGAYSAILPTSHPAYHPGLGYSAGAGVLYEYQKRSFLMQVGVGAQWMHAVNTTQAMADIAPYSADQMPQVPYAKTDHTRMLDVEVPMLFGQSLGMFYYLLGAKLGFITYKDARSTAVLQMSQDQLNALLDGKGTQVPNAANQSVTPLHHFMDARGVVELGFNLGGRHIDPASSRMQCRLGFYAETGIFAGGGQIFHVMASPHQVEITTPDAQASMRLEHYMYSYEGETHQLGAYLPLSAGIRLTLYVPHKQKR